MILQVSAGARKYAEHAIVRSSWWKPRSWRPACPSRCIWIMAKTSRSCEACIDGGFSSVMIDGSKHSFEENIAVTKQVADYAHAHGVVVEGELGQAGRH